MDFISRAGLIACGPSGRDGQTADASNTDSTQGTDGQNVDTSRVYAHSGGTLYRIDTVNLGTVQVGARMREKSVHAVSLPTGRVAD